MRSKHDKHVYYGLVNLRSDDFIKQGTNLDKGEQELFYKIVRSPQSLHHTGCATSERALRTQLEAIDACHDKDIEEMVAHNKRLDCQPRVSSEDATACLQQCVAAAPCPLDRQSDVPLPQPSVRREQARARPMAAQE